MTEDSTFRESHGQTHVEWTIKNFSTLQSEIDYMLQSSFFSLGDAKWSLKIFPNGESKRKSAGWVGLYLRKEDSATECQVEFKIGIIKLDNSKPILCEGEPKFDMKEGGWGTAKSIEKSALLSSGNSVASDGTLTVFCNIRLVDSVKSTVQSSSLGGLMALSTSFKDMYLNGIHTDVILKVQDKKFHAHRLILSARSMKLSSMLKYDMPKKKKEVVEILDCDPDAFGDFILFVYTGELPNLSSSKAMELYKIADKFDFEELKAECAYCMRCDLSVDSFCDVLHLAVLEDKSDFLQIASKFFTENAKSIIETPKWKAFVEKHPSLANKLFSAHLNRDSVDAI